MKNKRSGMVSCAVVMAVMVSGCMPSVQYRSGQGFYAEDGLSETQVQFAVSEGRAEQVGTFSETRGGCFNYSQDAVDEDVVIPSVKQGLQKNRANVATKISADQKWYDYPLYLFLLAHYWGCSNWEISGNALKVDPISN